MSFKSFTILLVHLVRELCFLSLLQWGNYIAQPGARLCVHVSLLAFSYAGKNLATSNTGVFIEIVWKIVSGTSFGLREWIELKMRLPFRFSSSPLGSLVLVTTLTFYTTVEERRRVLFCLYSCQSRAESLSGCGLV